MSSSTIFIRHALEQYDNGKGPDGCLRLDSSVLPGQESDIARWGKTLADTFGQPKRLIVSPFRRTRQTAQALIEHLDRKEQSTFFDESRGLVVESPEVVLNGRIGEYLGNKYKMDLKSNVDRLTYEHLGYTENKPDLVEFSKRIRSFIKEDLHKGDWIVTHGLTIKTIALEMGYKLDEMQCLDAFVILPNGRKLVVSKPKKIVQG